MRSRICDKFLSAAQWLMQRMGKARARVLSPVLAVLLHVFSADSKLTP
jgi:hypothetical protein